METNRRWIMAGLLSASLLNVAQAASLTIDPARSAVTFSVSNLGVHRVHGRFKTWTGHIEFDPSALTQSRVEVTIQADSIDTAIPKRDHHLRSRDFFDVARFPPITYTSQSVEVMGNQYRMIGVLTIKGVSKPVPVTFTFQTSVGPDSKVHLKAHGQTSVTREDFDLRYGNGFMIGHKVLIDLSIEAS